MQAIVISENGEEREFLSYVLRHAGLAVARTATVKLVMSSLLKQPVDLILLSAKGHTAVAAWRSFTPHKITLVDRDLLALQTTTHNLQQNGCPTERISQHHQIGLPPLDTAANLILHPLRDSEGPKLAFAHLALAADQLAPKGIILTAANSHLISQVEQQIRKGNGRLKPQKRKKRKGYSALSLTRQ
ncbi:MAG: methyltransferase [Anaerolineales bacterium]|nr:methyltransferase [Anaerolineales bacterium]